ncbi:MAG TPA: hypothetical protein VGH33_20740 [Isosphaeraceae bacterium]|jgi:hypothetical protein
MNVSREEVLAHVVEVLRSLEEDPDSAGDIAEDTYMVGDRNWRSIDIIFLANSMQEHYGQPFPFTELFGEIGQREKKDVAVGEWVDFIHQNLARGAAATHDEAKA